MGGLTGDEGVYSGRQGDQNPQTFGGSVTERIAGRICETSGKSSLKLR